MEIRIATPEDAAAIREIYAPYVLNTAVSFEYTLPDENEFRNRIANTLREYPYLVAIDKGRIAGYAYAGPFHSREAYRHSVELSVYVRQDCRRLGAGSLLYQELEKILIRQNIYTVHACIASPDEEDERLTDDSEKFHAKLGFKIAGRHDRCGYKFNKWYSVVWMDKSIREKTENPADFIPFSRI